MSSKSIFNAHQHRRYSPPAAIPADACHEDSRIIETHVVPGSGENDDLATQIWAGTCFGNKVLGVSAGDRAKMYAAAPALVKASVRLLNGDDSARQELADAVVQAGGTYDNHNLDAREVSKIVLHRLLKALVLTPDNGRLLPMFAAATNLISRCEHIPPNVLRGAILDAWASNDDATTQEDVSITVFLRAGHRKLDAVFSDGIAIKGEFKYDMGGVLSPEPIVEVAAWTSSLSETSAIEEALQWLLEGTSQ